MTEFALARLPRSREVRNKDLSFKLAHLRACALGWVILHMRLATCAISWCALASLAGRVALNAFVPDENTDVWYALRDTI
jgi:hypothetical protein